jgi:hypothetical protein
MVHDGSYGQFALLQQVDLIGTQFVQPELIGRFSIMFGELFDCSKVVPNRIIGVITTLEFLQHHFA